MVTIAQVAAAPPVLPAKPDQRDAVRRSSTLIMAMLLSVVIVLTVALVLLARNRRRLAERGGSTRRRRVRAKTDAWAESAKRLRIEGEAGPDDDTVDIDPDDPSEGFNRGGPGREGGGR